jgi:hypothetical protein
MAVFTRIHAFQDATPVGYRPDPPNIDRRLAPARDLVGTWVIADDGRLLRRWRMVADRSAV